MGYWILFGIRTYIKWYAKKHSKIQRPALCTAYLYSGVFPCLEVQFVFKRNLLHSIVQFYVPSALLVIISWLSFWMSPDAIPARITIGMMTVLTVTTHSTAANSQLPRMPYMKAIDVWMSTCLIFVFASLLEFAVIHVFSGEGIHQKPTQPTTGPEVETAPAKVLVPWLTSESHHSVSSWVLVTNAIGKHSSSIASGGQAVLK